MAPVRREGPNQHETRVSQAKSPAGSSKTALPPAAVRLAASIEDDLGGAIALAFSIELMGFGLSTLGDDYSRALITVTQSLIERLGRAKSACDALYNADHGEKHSRAGTHEASERL